jgi:hypothetical protein
MPAHSKVNVAKAVDARANLAVEEGSFFAQACLPIVFGLEVAVHGNILAHAITVIAVYDVNDPGFSTSHANGAA